MSVTYGWPEGVLYERRPATQPVGIAQLGIRDLTLHRRLPSQQQRQLRQH